MSWLDDLENDVEGTLQTLSDVVNAIGDAIKTGAKVAGEVVDPVGAAISYVVNGVAYDVYDLIGIHMRSLTNDERNKLREVFRNTVPLDKIVITSIPGASGRAYTTPGYTLGALVPFVPVIGPLLVLSDLVTHLYDKFLINVGGMYSDQSLVVTRTTYDKSHYEPAGSLLVHETTHVWQGVNYAFSWLYIVDSLLFQAFSSDAYAIDELHLHNWYLYNVEQQAHLVEEWYANGQNITTIDPVTNMPKPDPHFPYIRDNIRPGKPWAQTLLTVITNPLLAKQAGSTRGALVGKAATTHAPLVSGRPAANIGFRPGSAGSR